MPPGFYFYLGVFAKNGELIERIGNKIFVSEDEKNNYLIIFNGLAGLLEKLYRPIGDEYIAFDYE